MDQETPRRMTEEGRTFQQVSYDYEMDKAAFNRWMKAQRDAGWEIFHANLPDLFFKRDIRPCNL
jgi:hypothetical protein